MSSDRFTEHYRLLSADPVMRAKLLADPKIDCVDICLPPAALPSL